MEVLYDQSRIQTVLLGLLVLLRNVHWAKAQTEGDTGYDYNAAYDDNYDDDSVLGLEPEFDVRIVNVTVVAGQTAVLPCSIDYLGKYKVAWLDHNAMPLTYEDRRVVDDSRFSIVRPFIKEWNLQIQDIRWEDQGQYRCTINTSPIKDKIVQLHVKVPAQIIDELSSDDQTVQEGDTVVLVCNVTGVPRPEVTWYRREANSKATERERIGLTGEMVIIQNVTRFCDDIYECVARNGVPPAVSRQIRVIVEFPPEITMHNKRIGQQKGKDTILECIIQAYPQAANYWEKDGKQITSSNKHRIEAYDEGDNKITLSLRVQDIDDDDYGEYKCVAANGLGMDEEIMYLYQYTVPEHSAKDRAPTETLFIPWTPEPTYLPPIYSNPRPTAKKWEPYYNNIDEKGAGRENELKSGQLRGVGASPNMCSLLLVTLSILWTKVVSV